MASTAINTKPETANFEDSLEKKSNSSAEEEIEAQFGEADEEEASRVLRKVDWRLVPILSILYLVSFIDRSNSKCSRILLRLIDLNVPPHAHCSSLVLTESSWQCKNCRFDDGPQHEGPAVQHSRHAFLRSIYPARGAQ